MKFVLVDQADPTKTLRGQVDLLNGQLEIRLEGYGDCCSEIGKGVPVLVELNDGKPGIHVWSDINEQDPTHNIDLSAAAEVQRKPDEDDI